MKIFFLNSECKLKSVKEIKENNNSVKVEMQCKMKIIIRKNFKFDIILNI